MENGKKSLRGNRTPYDCPRGRSRASVAIKATGLTTQAFIKIHVTTIKVNDSLMTGREGGVENQSQLIDTMETDPETSRTNLLDNGKTAMSVKYVARFLEQREV